MRPCIKRDPQTYLLEEGVDVAQEAILLCLHGLRVLGVSPGQEARCPVHQVIAQGLQVAAPGVELSTNLREV